MKTGEGKTLTSTMPVYLNALTGKGVHVITVNEYLANRDARRWENFIFLGLTVGLNLNDYQKKKNKRHMLVISHMEQTMNLVLTICVTTWCFIKSKWYSVRCIMQSSMK